MNKKLNNKTPVEINYRIQQAIKQMVSNVPKGTDLELCDVISAMYSGYFVESGGGRHYVHHPRAITRLPALTMIFGSLFKYLAATAPPIRTGFWDRVAKPTYGRLVKHLKKLECHFQGNFVRRLRSRLICRLDTKQLGFREHKSLFRRPKSNDI